jgi:hypothetical protein
LSTAPSTSIREGPRLSTTAEAGRYDLRILKTIAEFEAGPPNVGDRQPKHHAEKVSADRESSPAW